MNQDFFEQLYDVDFNLNNIFVMRQTWSSGYVFTMGHPRPTDALLLFIDGEGICHQNASSQKIPQGSLVHLSQGSLYSLEFLSQTELSHTILFEFTMLDSQNNPIPKGTGVHILFRDKFEMFEKYFLRLLDEFSRPRSSPAAIKAAAYRLLSAVIKNKYQQSVIDINTSLIADGISYLEGDPKQEKSIAEIAKMCNVSVNYFERLFKSYSGETPSEYRLKMKIEKAKQFLASDLIGIGQISEELGFSDSAYFCRIFRKKTGMTPKAYRSLYRKK